MTSMRRCVPVVVGLLVAGCCRNPDDPAIPGATPEAAFAGAWLDDLAAHRDGAALAKLDLFGAAPQGWDEQRFGQRVDRLDLRSFTDLEWTGAHYLLNEANPNSKDPAGERVLTCIANANPALSLTASLQLDGRAATLELMVTHPRGGLALGRVRVDDEALVPDDMPRIVRKPVEPAGERAVAEPESAIVDVGAKGLEDAIIDRHAVGPTSFLRARASHSLEGGASARIETECRYGDRWVRKATVSHTPGAVQVSARMSAGSPDPCTVTLVVSESTTQRTRTWCWRPSATTDGACAEQPARERRSDAPVFVDAVAPSVTNDGGFGIAYALYVNDPLPAPGQPQRNTLVTTLRCGQQAPRRLTRPLDGEQYPAGVFEELGARADVQVSALDWPCDVEFSLEREDPYERHSWSLFHGCASADDVVAGPCGAE